MNDDFQNLNIFSEIDDIGLGINFEDPETKKLWDGLLAELELDNFESPKPTQEKTSLQQLEAAVCDLQGQLNNANSKIIQLETMIKELREQLRIIDDYLSRLVPWTMEVKDIIGHGQDL